MRVFISVPYTKIADKFDDYIDAIGEIVTTEVRAGNTVICPVLVYKTCANCERSKVISHDVWIKRALTDLRICDLMLVLKFPDWRESVGVIAEIEMAEAMKIPVEFIEMDRLIGK